MRGDRVAEYTAGSGTWMHGDDVLVSRAIGGDQDAFAELTRRHREVVLRVAAQIVGLDKAEDVVQDALLLAFWALPTIADPSKFSRWLNVITRFQALQVQKDEAANRMKRVTLDETVVGTWSELACAPRTEEEGDDRVLVALAKVPPDLAEVLRLRFLHDFPHQKIADFLGISVSTAKWRCKRGKEILKELLLSEYGGYDWGRMRTGCVGCFCPASQPDGSRMASLA